MWAMSESDKKAIFWAGDVLSAREVGPGGGRLPDFIIIGAAKCGTTTLYEYLCRHPQVFMSVPKEPHFFAREPIYAKGMDWYRSLFSGAQASQVCGEASTLYTRWPDFPNCARRVAEHVPKAKLIYVMRHPIDRAYSGYGQRIKWIRNVTVGGREQEMLDILTPLERAIYLWLKAVYAGGSKKVEQVTFEELLQVDEALLTSGLYMQQIRQYLGCFPRGRFLFVLFEDLVKDPAGVCREALRFLGVDPAVDVVGDRAVAKNAIKKHQEHFVRGQTTGRLKRLPGARRLGSVLPRSFKDAVYEAIRRTPYGKRVERRSAILPMKPETRARLVEYFRGPNRELGEFLGRDLSHWDT